MCHVSVRVTVLVKLIFRATLRFKLRIKVWNQCQVSHQGQSEENVRMRFRLK